MTPTPTATPRPLRTVAMIQADPAVDSTFVIVDDKRRSEYELQGATFVEDLVGDQCLMKRPLPVGAPKRTRPIAVPPTTKSTKGATSAQVARKS